MKWVKMHVAALRHPAFRRLNSDARLTFLACIGLAGECDAGGSLTIRGVGPMTVSEISDITGLAVKTQEKALQDVLAIGWMTRDLSGAYKVERFEEKSGSDSELAANRERQKRYRAKHNGQGNGVTNGVTDGVSNGVSNEITNVTNVTDIEEEVEEEVDIDALRVSAEKIPNDPKVLGILADAFSRAFGNNQTPEARAKHRAGYADFLAVCSSRGVTMGQAAEACKIAREMNGGKPLFGSSVKRAISYLPGRGNLRPVRPATPYDGDLPIASGAP